MAHLGTIGTATLSTTSSSITITLSAGAPVGSTVLLGIAWDAAAGGVPTIASVTDSRGNSWSTTPDMSVAAGTTVAVGGLRARVTTALLTGDTITVTISGAARGRWAAQADAHSEVNTTPLDKTASNAPGSSASLSTGVTAATTQANELVVAVFAFGSGRTVTVPSGWAAGPKVETTAGSGDRALLVAHRYVSATGTQEGTLGLSSASTYAAAVATYKYTPSGPPAVRISQVSFEVPNPSDAPLVRISQVAFEVPAATVGAVRIAQVSLEVPAAPGQRPPTGIKVLSDGVLQEAGLSVATQGEV
ncbi:hypothetical protein [Actinomadura decatromicini]|uniref:Uncharacterized protein n=1 Tax=Actinomadura decatromicini TaxID=2604572 RepID=A0A5D3FB60_9ACTN|nr:hypothetical protein [Actinomadura decatromicini]TYK45144.1 hypothetical protein FXF68_31175 [Actinomadura decatromicini]